MSTLSKSTLPGVGSPSCPSDSTRNSDGHSRNEQPDEHTMQSDVIRRALRTFLDVR
jgi:hypothetical protein